MASVARNYDCLIFGGGIAGTLLAWSLMETGMNPLVVDNDSRSSCSRVAAGLINPIAGKRLNLVWEAERAIPFALDRYRSLGNTFGTDFFYPRAIIRLLNGVQSQAAWEQKQALEYYQKWICPKSDIALPDLPELETQPWFAVRGGGYLDMNRLLDHLRLALEKSGNLKSADFQYADISITKGCVSWSDIQTPLAVFAEGWLGRRNPLFSFAPFRPAKGVIGRIRTNVDLRDTAIIDDRFLIPRADGTVQVGATYDWENLNESPDDQSVASLEAFLEKRLPSSWEWVDRKAGIRPSLPGAKPLVGPHPDHRHVFAFNGFGSKGATQIPIFAQRLCNHIRDGKDLPPESLPSRFSKRNQAFAKRWIAVEIARDRVQAILQHGDIAIDATAGNGHDTLWLSAAVGENGRVHAIDIQNQAIESAQARIEAAGMSNRVSFARGCHSRLKELLPASVVAKAVVFNLGYLPSGAKQLITRASTTIKALEAAVSLLHPQGILSIIAYPGHDGGEAECRHVMDWIDGLDRSAFQIEIAASPSGNASGPIVLFAQKRP